MGGNIYHLSRLTPALLLIYTAGLFGHSFQSIFLVFFFDLDSRSSPTFITLLFSHYLSHWRLILLIDIYFVHTAPYNYHGFPNDSFFPGPFGYLCRPSCRAVGLRHINTLLVHFL